MPSQPRTITLAPVRRTRLLLVLLAASVLIAGFMWFAVDLGQGIGTISVLVAASVGLVRFAVPSQKARQLELGPEELVIRRASPVVSTVAWAELVGAAVLDADADAELELRPGDPNAFRARHPELRGPHRAGAWWKRLFDRTDHGVPYDVRRVRLAAGNHVELAKALAERFDTDSARAPRTP